MRKQASVKKISGKKATVKKEKNYMGSKEETKDIHIRLPIQDYNLLEERSKIRNLDITNYLRYLVREDKDDFQCQGAANAMDKISAATVGLLEACDNSQCQCSGDCTIRPFIIDISEGVKNLWRYLR